MCKSKALVTKTKLEQISDLNGTNLENNVYLTLTYVVNR